jgi:hypothetical protein
MTIDFTPWPKIPRINQEEITITEKIDGTNAAVGIREIETLDGAQQPHEWTVGVVEGKLFAVRAQSRKRFITPDTDNYGFADWVSRNVLRLIEGLGEGLHFGEWWGEGIQKNRYNVERKYFSLFNTYRWDADSLAEAGLLDVGVRVVPELIKTGIEGLPHRLSTAKQILQSNGSLAAKGEGATCYDPEGVVLHFRRGDAPFKFIFSNPDTPKSALEVNGQEA